MGPDTLAEIKSRVEKNCKLLNESLKKHSTHTHIHTRLFSERDCSMLWTILTVKWSSKVNLYAKQIVRALIGWWWPRYRDNFSQLKRLQCSCFPLVPSAPFRKYMTPRNTEILKYVNILEIVKSERECCNASAFILRNSK